MTLMLKISKKIDELILDKLKNTEIPKPTSIQVFPISSNIRLKFFDIAPKEKCKKPQTIKCLDTGEYFKKYSVGPELQYFIQPIDDFDGNIISYTGFSSLESLDKHLLKDFSFPINCALIRENLLKQLGMDQISLPRFNTEFMREAVQLGERTYPIPFGVLRLKFKICDQWKAYKDKVEYGMAMFEAFCINRLKDTVDKAVTLFLIPLPPEEKKEIEELLNETKQPSPQMERDLEKERKELYETLGKQLEEMQKTFEKLGKNL